MKPVVWIITCMLFLFIGSSIYSQEEFTSLEVDKPTNGLYVGGQASTNGWGFDLRYIFNKSFTLKAGMETMDFTQQFSFDQDNIDFNADLDYQTGGLFLMADFNFTKSLYISGGVVKNNLNPTFKGMAANDIQYGDIYIPASEIGVFEFTLTPELEISPYAGIGIRTFLGSNERILFNFETGFYYFGTPEIEIEADGILTPTADPANGRKELLENQFSQYKYYPVVKLNFAIKLF